MVKTENSPGFSPHFPGDTSIVRNPLLGSPSGGMTLIYTDITWNLTTAKFAKKQWTNWGLTGDRLELCGKGHYRFSSRRVAWGLLTRSPIGSIGSWGGSEQLDFWTISHESNRAFTRVKIRPCLVGGDWNMAAI